MAMPFAPGAARAFLTGQPRFVALVSPENIATRDLPEEITGPCVTIRSPGNVGGDPMLRRPMIQVDAWVPKLEILGGDIDPDEVAWNIAALAGELIGKARTIRFRNAAWSGKWVDGPITFPPDIKRGPDFPLFRATIRAELKMRINPA